jgi:hypothetical protein
VARKFITRVARKDRTNAGRLRADQGQRREKEPRE